MLHQTFRVVAVITSLLGLIYMFSESTYKFSIYPITILVGIAYSSFEKNEEEYYERNKYNIDSGWLTDDDLNTKHTYYQTPNPYTKNGYRKSSIDGKKYTEVAKKCKKNTLVTKQQEEKEEINNNNLTH